MSKHYKFSPSAAHRWIVCPGEVPARLSAPVSTSVYADEGTNAHALAEHCLKNKKMASIYCAQWQTFGGKKFFVEAEMTQFVGEYVRECQSWIDNSDWHAVEIQSSLPELHEELGGTCDFAAYQKSSKTLIVRDLKYGKGKPVAPENNPQLMIYALEAMNAVINKFSGKVQIDHIDMGIHQPRNGGLKTWTIRKLDLLAWVAETLKPAIDRVEEGDEERVAGKHCFFCPVKATCSAQYNAIVTSAVADFSQPATLPKAPQDIPLEKLEQILLLKDYLEDWLSAAEKHVQAQLMQGVPSSLFKIVRANTNRVWAPDAEKKLVAMLGTNVAYKKPQLINQTEAKARFAALGVDFPDELLIKPEGGLVLAPVTDKRPAVSTTSAEQDFMIEDLIG